MKGNGHRETVSEFRERRRVETSDLEVRRGVRDDVKHSRTPGPIFVVLSAFCNSAISAFFALLISIIFTTYFLCYVHTPPCQNEMTPVLSDYGEDYLSLCIS